MKTFISFLLMLSFISQTIAQESATRLRENSNQEVIARMKLEEKVSLLVGMLAPPAGSPQVPVKVLGAAGRSAALPHLGIPSVVLADGPAGLRIAPTRPNETKTFYATAFPIPTLLAATWDADAARRIGAAMGIEAREYGVDIILAPGMNIHRNPLGGRNFEYYSEDPLLTGKTAGAFVRGVQSNGVGTAVKHFAVNNQETNRNRLNVKIGERALREIYLRGFEIAVKEASPWTVMSSYNKINGTYASQNEDLLTRILRSDWKFKGFVMTDWFAGDNAVEQMSAGNNLLMPGSRKQVSDIIEAVKSGRLDEKVLDKNLDEMLNVVKQTQSYQNYRYSNQPDLKAHGAVARSVASEGVVLLKNERNALPLLGKNLKIAAFGIHTYDLVSGGTGSADVNEAYTVPLTEGLKNAGYSLNESLKTKYENYIRAEKDKQPKQPRTMFSPPPDTPEMTVGENEIEAATAGDLAVVTVGRVSGESADRKIEDFYLNATEKELIKNVSAAFRAKGKKVLVILNVGAAVEVASWRDSVDAILLAWLPGQEAGDAIADVLTGKINPSGKLPTTFPVKYDDDPTAANFPGKEFGEFIGTGWGRSKVSEVEYSEGIYVGYRGFDKRGIQPAYEFGYGLSYTDFKYGDLKLSSKKFKGKLTVRVTVKNTGVTAGKEVVQLYLSAPANTTDKPAQELKNFAKTKLLQPNESQILIFEINHRDLASFDETTRSWLAEAGNYTVKIGSSSRNIKLESDFKLAKNITVEKLTKPEL